MPEVSHQELEDLERLLSARYWIWRGVAIVFALFVLIIVATYASKLIGPKLNLYKSNTEKQAVIKEQEAISEAEVYAAEKRVIAARADAEARVIEAEGIAEAQRIISSTLDDDYLQWRFYEVLGDTENDIIYVPTEGNLPITEAQRLAPTPAPEQGD